MEEAEADGRDTDIADIERVLSAARQLLHLINDILDLSKIEAGRMDVVASEFDVAALIEEAAATVRPNVEKNGNALEARDRRRSRRGAAAIRSSSISACSTCLSNAAKFTQDGEITMRARRARERRLDRDRRRRHRHRHDRGAGRAPVQRVRAGRRARPRAAMAAPASASRITRRMMQMLGGDVSVTSAQGKGSTFTLRFPAQLAARCRRRRASMRRPRPGRARERLVLLIDDEESARDLTARSLTRLGFDVRSAATGADGLDAGARRCGRASSCSTSICRTSPAGTCWPCSRTGDAADIPVIVHSDRRQSPARACRRAPASILVKPADRDVLAAAALRFARAPDTAKPADAPAISTRSQDGVKGPPMRILIAEDHPDNREMLTRRLERRGYEVHCAENGAEAVEMAKTLLAGPDPDGYLDAGDVGHRSHQGAAHRRRT